MSKNKIGNAIISMVLFVVSIGIAFFAGESILRIKNSSMKNYDIEMWRYALELKRKSDIPILGHEHISSRKATLQSVEIRTNKYGLRGDIVPPVTLGKRRILFLGSSITLGWGVPESETMTERLSEMFKADGLDVEVLNGGIGNYNAVRYVERFMKRLTDLKPTDIVVHYFLRDAEVLEAGGGNVLLRNSQLAVTTWVALSRYFGKNSGKTLDEHYHNVYESDSEGFIEMRKALHKLSEYAQTNNIRIYLAMSPDVHDLVNYKFIDIHDIMRDVAKKERMVFIDLLPSMVNLTPHQLWSMPGDPHPNGLGHQLMAETIYPVLKLPKD